MKEFLFHLIAVIIFLVFNRRALMYSKEIMENVKPMNDNIVTVLIQLCTFWNFALQQIYFFCCLIDDIKRLTAKSQNTGEPSPLRQRCTSVCQRYVIPGAIGVSVNFWVIMSINPRYIDNYGVLYNYIPSVDNHALHTLVTILAFAELFITYRPYTSNITADLKATNSLFTIYFTAVAAAQPFSDIWVYPFFGMMSWSQWFVYVLSVYLLASVAYIAGRIFTNVVWSKDRIENYSSLAFKMGAKAA